MDPEPTTVAWLVWQPRAGPQTTTEVISMEEMERGKKIQTDVQIILEVISQVYKVKFKYKNNDSMGGYPY